MNVFLSLIENHSSACNDLLKRDQLTTLQVNLGNLCNQVCQHCHVEAFPNGKNIMTKKVMDDILAFLKRFGSKTLDITGGAPELNPQFEYFVAQARPLAHELIVRSNLTVLFEPGKEHLPDFYKKHKVRLVCSLPCYLEQNVDAQRGEGVFQKSVAALRLLNQRGFARDDELVLDLVYNPIGPSLPPKQEALERQYKEILSKDYGIIFNRLLTITNVAIRRFKSLLVFRGEYERYQKLLSENFNPDVVRNLMCRTFLSVGFDGKLYDCDFNQVLGLALYDGAGEALTIDRLDPESLNGRDIIMGEHCLACTAGCGSSCQGALDDFKRKPS